MATAAFNQSFREQEEEDYGTENEADANIFDATKIPDNYG